MDREDESAALEVAKYIDLFTMLPEYGRSASAVLEWYRAH